MASKKSALSMANARSLATDDVMRRLANRAETSIRDAGRVSPRAASPAAHRYRAGQTVTLVPNRYGAARQGRYEVTRLLPQEHGINQYRLKSVSDGHERVAREDELA